MKKVFYILVLLIITSELHGSQEITSFVPKTYHLVFQTAGLAGFVSGGIGFDLGDRFIMDLLLGWVPESLGGEDLFSFAWKTSFGFLKGRNTDAEYGAYAGIFLLYSFDDDTFVALPGQYPKDYYAPTAIRTAAYLGFEVQKERYSWYIEITALDIYLEAKVRNWTQLGWDEVTSLGFGFKYYFADNGLLK